MMRGAAMPLFLAYRDRPDRMVVILSVPLPVWCTERDRNTNRFSVRRIPAGTEGDGNELAS